MNNAILIGVIIVGWAICSILVCDRCAKAESAEWHDD